mgnify:CR=1 FL=1
MKTRFVLLVLLLLPQLLSVTALAQTRLPIIDMQLHAHTADSQGPPPLGMCTPINPFPVWDPAEPYADLFLRTFKNPPCDDPVWSPMTDDELMHETLAMLDKWNIYGVLSGSAELVAKWRSVKPERLYPAIEMAVGPDAPSPEELRAMHVRGDLMVLGELTTQYRGILPDDPRLSPYFALAEELDIPVGIHVGPGPPGVIYLGASNYRAKMHSPLTLEDVLVKHPKMRLYIMHGGYPMLEDLLAVLYAHPQVYVDIGVVVFTQPREAFYRWLKGVTDAGFSNRIMFGSDHMIWPEVLERSIAVIEEAPFLTEPMKRDIFYNNAARFLRLSPEEIARHHGN